MPEALVASLALAVLTTLIVGTVPAWHASRQDLGDRHEGVGEGYGREPHTRLAQAWRSWPPKSRCRWCSCSEPGLLMQRFIALVNADLGIDTSHIAFVQPRFEKPDTPAAAQRHQYYAEALGRVRAVTGVSDASITSGFGGRPLLVVRPGTDPMPGDRGALSTFCDENFLALLGLPPLRGRSLVAVRHR